MTVSLHTASIDAYLQILPSVLRWLDKAEAHCRAAGGGDEALTGCRLAPDMWDFAKQVSQCAYHSAGAIRGVRAGVFRPDPTPVPQEIAALRSEIESAIAFLKTVDPGELDAIAQRDMVFEFGERRMDFTVADFLLSFSLPNFFFHATSAYAILRNQGLAVGKRDFLGALRLKGA